MLTEEIQLILSKLEELVSKEVEMAVEDPEAGTIPIHLLSKEEFEEGQVGYRIDEGSR
ncbi:hypothetical protein [Mesobacillus foraminis]|uniref:hypothetical protein n=1 Tax=Mesobacillus foraminis TaxID=279826 RepID=UPI0020358156|nr:hypothetical protein [Mesobacillus foraminis]